MKHLISILAFISIALTSFSQTNIWWFTMPEASGKIHHINPVLRYTEDGSWYDSTLHYFCIEEHPKYQFKEWRVRFYSERFGIRNDTIYDTCMYIEEREDVYEIGIHAIMESKVGINEPINATILIYPNPFDNTIYLNMVVDEYKVYNADGKLLDKGYNTDMVDLTEYSTGLYIIVIQNRIYKIIKP